MYSKEAVVDALSRVLDPDFKKDIVSMNMVEELEVSEGKISFSLVLTTPACPFKEKIKSDCIDAIHKHIDKSAVIDIKLSSRITRGGKRGKTEMPGIHNVVGIASGKGGVGKSTVAVNIALSLSKTGARVGLLDADIYGPSVPIMLGIEKEVPETIEINGVTKVKPVEAFGLKVISIGFFVDASKALVWRGPMASGALKQLLTDTVWGELDYLIVDLPPGTGDIQLTLAQTVSVNGIVIVSTPQKVATSDALKGIAMFKDTSLDIPVLGIIENMAWFTPAELPDTKYYIFGKDGCRKLSEETGVPLLGSIPLIQALRESADEGKPCITENDALIAAHFDHAASMIARELVIRSAGIKDITQHHSH